MRRLIIILACVLLAGSAGAADKWGDCSDLPATGKVTTVEPGKIACSDLVGDNPTTELIYVGKCKTFDYFYNPDTGGAGTAISTQLMICLTDTISSSHCEPFDGLTITGTATDNFILGASGLWAYVKGTGTIGTEDPRAAFKCDGD